MTRKFLDQKSTIKIHLENKILDPLNGITNVENIIILARAKVLTEINLYIDYRPSKSKLDVHLHCKSKFFQS